MADKWRRSERIVLISKELFERPHHLFTVGYFSGKYQAARSSISEDITVIREMIQSTGQGDIVTIAGPRGGIKYIPGESRESEQKFLQGLVEKLSDPSRILPGGYLYMLDLIYDPNTLRQLAKIFARRFAHCQPDYIVTVETKGIPLALMTAQVFDVPLVIVRNDSRITEGTSVSINYMSGSSHKIGTMTLAKKAIKNGTRVIIIDDFMRAGGTALGLINLMQEFKVEVLAIGVLISTTNPQEKLVQDYLSLLELNKVDHIQKKIDIYVKDNTKQGGYTG